MTDPTPLSPQAQAVLDAVEDDCIHPTDLHCIAAAALRAAAEVLREAYANEQYPDHPDDYLFDLAAELEGANA